MQLAFLSSPLGQGYKVVPNDIHPRINNHQTRRPLLPRTRIVSEDRFALCVQSFESALESPRINPPKTSLISPLRFPQARAQFIGHFRQHRLAY